MESGQFLHGLGRRAWLVVIIPVLAAVIAFAIAWTRPEENRSSSLVLTHPEIAQFGSNVAYVTAFQAALTTDQVLKGVSTATNIPLTDLRAGLSAEPSASNSLAIKVTYQGTQSKPETLQASQEASRAVTQELYGPQLKGAQSAVTEANAAAKAASTALSDFSEKTGLYSPSQDYAALLGELAQLRVLLAQTQATVSTPRYDKQSIQAEIVATTSRLDRLAPQLAMFQSLQSAAADAQSAQQSTNAELASVQNAAALSAGDGSLLAGSTTTVSSTSDAARAAGAAALAGFILAGLWVGLVSSRSNDGDGPGSGTDGRQEPTLREGASRRNTSELA